MKLDLHPIRATLAVLSIGATVYFIIANVVIPDAWWVIATGVAVFYFGSQGE